MNSDNKYNNGKIYTIRCTDNNNLIYVGSTTQPLYKRWYEHKQIYNKEGKQYNKLLYSKMRELGVDKFFIELYENFKCENIEQLHKKEGEIIRQIATLNKKIEGRTFKEYYKDNKEKIKQYKEDNKEKIKENNKEYRDNNKEKIKETRKEYYLKNKEEIKEEIKQYKEDNKEKILRKKKEYYEENKPEILQKMAIKINCVCGSFSCKGNLSRHEKSKKHIEFINNNNSSDSQIE